jgi:UDP-N-acetylmuramoyl-tripeptide--D-alanyl-D-alanine ligase
LKEGKQLKNITVKDILNICDGKLICGNENIECIRFEKDTRMIQKGDTFIGIKGENFDGNMLYKDALAKGAEVCIVSGIDAMPYRDRTIIEVEDSILALQQIAKYKRNMYDIPVIAVTGSVGKTSTKDIIASVMSQKYKVLKTQGNLNNQIGLPLTILQLQDHEAMVVEMGMNHFGEIRTLTNIAKPTVSVISNIGTSHIGILGSRENILKAKLEILEGTIETSTVIINNDNDLLYKWGKNNNTKHKIITYGIENKSNLTASNIKLYKDRSEFSIYVDEKEYNVIVPVGGKHFIQNALSAICAGLEYNIEIKKIIEGIKAFELTKSRMEVVKGINDSSIINDTYNASYDSVKSALEYIHSIEGNKKISILGDMLELGDYEKKLHEKIGEEVVKNGIDILITVGRASRYIAQKVKEMSNKTTIYECNTNEEAIKIAKYEIKENDIVLVKASRGMHFEEIVRQIEKEN